VAGTLTRGEFEGIRRSAAMAPLDHQQVVRLLDAYGEVLAERERTRATLKRLREPWGEMRAVVNALSRQCERG
jgi:hypothetical protein